MSNIIENSPGFNMMAVGSDFSVVYSVEEQGQGFQKYQRSHNPMYSTKILLLNET